MFQNGLSLTIKTGEHIRNQPKTANPNSPWTYMREGVLSEGYLRLNFFWGGEGEGLFFGRSYFWGGGIYGISNTPKIVSSEFPALRI